MFRPLVLPLLAAVTSVAVAQETYWIANRASNDIMEVTPWGSVLQRIAMGTSLRSAHVAPDGKIWVVRFIQGTLDIVDPVTSTITPVTSTLGSPYFIAFDNQGTAWVSGGTGVQNFAANGTLIQAYPLTATAPLGITIDASGNKWIAHRATPASVSRIDPSGAVVNFPLPGVTTQPTALVADFRGLFNPSHIWIVGDGAGELVEVDDQGNLLNIYPTGLTSVGSVTFDLAGNIWVGSFGGGAVAQIDRTTGATLSAYTLSPSVLGLNFDSYGRLWATARVTFSGVGPPCEVRRVDPASGVIEVPGVLQSGAFAAAGTQSPISTPYQYSLVVAPIGDLDGDGDANFAEIQNGTSPTDPASNGNCHIDSRGAASVGSTPVFDVKAGAGTFWLFALSFGLVPVGSGYTNPAFTGELRLDPALALPVTLSGVGNASLPLAIPLDPAFAGLQFFTQGFRVGAGGQAFTNIGGLLIW